MDNFFEFYNRHYITTRSDGAITAAWSDGPHPKKDTANAICINEKGSYQFRLILDSELTEENPPIYAMDGIPLYKWGGSQVLPRTEEEIEADRAAIPAPPPTEQERLRADVDSITALTGITFVVMAEAGQIDAVTAAEHADLFTQWAYPVDYKTGQIRRYTDGKLYKCLQDHTSQEDWTPPAAVSLWVAVADPAEEWPEWSQPLGAHDAYNAGDKVSHNGKHWISDLDANVWEPGVYGWSANE